MNERDLVSARTLSRCLVNERDPQALEQGQRTFNPFDLDRNMVHTRAPLLQKPHESLVAFGRDELESAVADRQQRHLRLLGDDELSLFDLEAEHALVSSEGRIDVGYADGHVVDAPDSQSSLLATLYPTSRGLPQDRPSAHLGLASVRGRSNVWGMSTTQPNRSEEMPVADSHFVTGAPMKPPFPASTELAMFGMGCFWGAERKFWQAPGVVSTMVGYAGGVTPNPTYREVCTGKTGHAEVVRLVFDPKVVSYEVLLRLFWENHDPTQGMRQGNDIGTQYRSAIYAYGPRQERAAERSREAYERELRAAGYGKITTDIAPAPEFYYAEDHHQQYLAKNPNGYCGLGGTGVACPSGLASPPPSVG